MPAGYVLKYSTEAGATCEVRTDRPNEDTVTEVFPCAEANVKSGKPGPVTITVIARKNGLSRTRTQTITFVEAPQLEVLNKDASVLPNKSVTIRLAGKNLKSCKVSGDTVPVYAGNPFVLQTQYTMFGCDSLVVRNGSTYNQGMVTHYTITASNGDPDADIKISGEIKQEIWKLQVDSWSSDHPLVGNTKDTWLLKFRCEDGCFSSATAHMWDEGVVWKGMLFHAITPGTGDENGNQMIYYGPKEVGILIIGSFYPGHYQWIIADQTGQRVSFHLDIPPK